MVQPPHLLRGKIHNKMPSTVCHVRSTSIKKDAMMHEPGEKKQAHMTKIVSMQLKMQ